MSSVAIVAIILLVVLGLAAGIAIAQRSARQGASPLPDLPPVSPPTTAPGDARKPPSFDFTVTSAGQAAGGFTIGQLGGHAVCRLSGLAIRDCPCGEHKGQGV